MWTQTAWLFLVCTVGIMLPAFAVSPAGQPMVSRASTGSSKATAVGNRALVAAVHDSRKVARAEEAAKTPEQMHANLFTAASYPSATLCRGCHPKHYQEWSVSQHAYAQMSPVFNAMHGKILKLTNGTNGDFCIRCHTPVGMNLGERIFMSNIDRHPTSREGITCIVCHRVNQAYGKLSGRLTIVQGGLTAPVYGPVGDNTELQKAIQKGGLTPDPSKGGRPVHKSIPRFFQLTTSGHCGTCHDVTLVNGFRLEEAFSEYKNSPAAKQGVSCQDCHMGKEPGRIVTARSAPDFERQNYFFEPVAQVTGVEIAPRKRTNHMFVGPDYSVLHPALFPLHPLIKEEHEKDNLDIQGFTIRQWLRFNWKAGWGTDAFEDQVPDAFIDTAWEPSDTTRPEPYRWQKPWDNPDTRLDAREVIAANLRLLQHTAERRLTLLRNGYKLGEIVVAQATRNGIRLRVQVMNGTDGHNAPTGFDAERLVWLFVRVFDADGTLVYQSGDLDPNGDLRDLHSTYVHNHALPLDQQLFSLQSRFLVRNIRGGEREQVLAVNQSPSPLPFLRPERRSSILLGRPGGARKHKKGIEPLGHRWARYTIKQPALTGKGPYKAVIELKAGMVPVNLINEIRDVGFDYNMSARTVADTLVHGHIIRGGADGEQIQQVIWNADSDRPADNQVVGHQVIWRREIVIDIDRSQDR